MTEELDINELEVCEDPNLYPEEKETSIWFSRSDDRATVHTDEASLTRRLLAHPEAEPIPTNMTIRDGNVMSFYGTVPVGCLKVLSNPRESGGHYSVVSNHDRSEK